MAQLLPFQKRNRRLLHSPLLGLLSTWTDCRSQPGEDRGAQSFKDRDSRCGSSSMARGFPFSGFRLGGDEVGLPINAPARRRKAKRQRRRRLVGEKKRSVGGRDIIERFHITAFVLFVLAQNILEAEGSWFGSFLTNALLVYVCEIFIDATKHSFLAKFNEIKPIAYSEFLEDLCKQTLNTQSEDGRKNLNFIPLAPACVVIRVLTPIYATVLPYGPLPWRLLWILFWSALTFVFLAICKILVGLSLNRLATWYLNQRQERKHHAD
ncbi:hypothetical protein Taro_027760 [Colocasia esculenta]|uniref:Protein POLLEN DEFECTIVE IN GUIDANCE 1 n=1 Tax=Colocasia esculenta TaxID=4460 RepID=A0A843VL28_COLES|nr:hypothetical protein [Colocasia esculenta]